MPTYQFDVYIPFVSPFTLPESLISRYADAYEELSELSGHISFFSDEFGEAKVWLEAAAPDAEMEELLSRFLNQSGSTAHDRILKISSRVTAALDEQEFRDIAAQADDSVLKKLLVSAYTKNVYDFLVALQLARPGLVHADPGVVAVNGALYERTKQLTSPVREARHSMESDGWPAFHDIPIRKAWQWVLEDMEAFDNFSATPVQRALHAFTYLFDNYPNDLSATLFWSLVGLEALYVRGKQGVVEQIYEKSRVLLGDQADALQRIKQMYRFRTNLVSGTLNIPSYFHINDDTDESETYALKTGDAAFLAVAMLTATLQELIVRDRKKLEFRYVLGE